MVADKKRATKGVGREDNKRVTKGVQKELRIEKVNHLTGEIESTETVTERLLPKEPNFVKLYLKDLMYLSDLPPSLNTIMYELLTMMDYANIVVMNAGMKRIIAGRTGLSFSSVSNAISVFVKGKLLERIDTGVYRANPYLFGKGEWKNVDQIRMEVTYTLEGKTLKGVISVKEV